MLEAVKYYMKLQKRLVTLLGTYGEEILCDIFI